MISSYFSRNKKLIASYLLLLHFAGLTLPAIGQRQSQAASIVEYSAKERGSMTSNKKNLYQEIPTNELSNQTTVTGNGESRFSETSLYDENYSGGPSQPEMASFKSVGVDNMVNLFTGDFNYNIPLLDVGGYPVNIFYDGGVSMDQEASWVGLGWNINPGNINRNMRGVPDDFDGTDTMIQVQNMKPNVTWGGSLAGDLEITGVKTKLPDWLDISAGFNVGLSVNNYLGPALEAGLKGGANFKIADKVFAEKNGLADSIALKIKLGGSANLSSRDGFTVSPNVSLTAIGFKETRTISNGLSLATSYNSRSGIKALQISDQTTFNFQHYKTVTNEQNKKIRTNEKDGSTGNSFLLSTAISFAKPSYIPAIRMPLTNQAYAGHFQLGGGIFGVYGSAEIEVYNQRSTVEGSDTAQYKPMVGYLYYQKAKANPHAVMDFTRLNDNEVTSKTPVISAPQYTYDVFSIQGEGTGGSVRAYRNDMGYVRDNYTTSQDKSLSIGGDVGPPGHYGGNFNTVKTPSTIGEWENGNKLRTVSTLGFENSAEMEEAVYFRNPGETSVLNEHQFDKIGGTDLVRFKLGGSDQSPSVEPQLERFAKDGVAGTPVNLLTASDATGRKKRTQVISFLTANEASRAGLDTAIKSYDYNTAFDADTNLVFENIRRVSEYRKAHHISQVNVTEANGRRYVYGIPVYNIVQKDFTFSVSATAAELPVDKVAFDAGNVEATSSLLETGSLVNGMVQRSETPAYAHSFLLSGLLSSDYVDVSGNGITEDDLGDAVKFNYSRIKQGSAWAVHKWRTPLTKEDRIANLNSGSLTNKKDNKGLISYGERESWYMHSIESKTMIALFILEDRDDVKNTKDEFGEIDAADNSLKRLKKIDLYSKSDIKIKGLAKAKPIKTVWFHYNYSLCAGTPDNYTTGGGKLTLTSISFTYNGQTKANKSEYVFSYQSTAADNPIYDFNASDRWGTYKPARMNPAALKNSIYPYADQSNKDSINTHAGAWALKKILLPSGGQIEIEYESDDYAFVQNKRASAMMKIAGFGSDAVTTPTANLYKVNGNGNFTENNYVFIEVPEACSTKAEVAEKYLKEVKQLAFKIAVRMPDGFEYVNSYAEVEDYNVYSSSPAIIWVKLKLVDDEISPISLTALEYLREQLPGQAYEGYEISDNEDIGAVGQMMKGMLANLKYAFTDPINRLRGDGAKAQATDLLKSFVRLNDPDGYKYGGGSRVKSVKLKDNWAAMTQQYNSVYGKEYDYTTTESFNGATRTISSGVASYEPSIGGEENPFQEIIHVANKLPLGPTSYGAIEMPVLDALFPAPLVGYSKVTVRSVKKNSPNKSRSGVGKQVTEFYTAKDFPVYYNYTGFDVASDKQAHTSSFTSFFYKSAFDSRALSQGFIVATNDMHGKMKSQSSYAENDPSTRINYTENFYRNTGVKGLDEKFDFIHPSKDGEIEEGNMGIDIELMTDTREFAVKSNSLEIQGQVDWFPIFIIGWLPFIWPVSGYSENTYRAITTTKVINYHGIVDSVVVIDKGSQVSTKNLVYDAETGGVIVSRTNNEFDKPLYSVNYPAYWAYSGMGLAYKNIDAVYSDVAFSDGKITNMSASAVNGIFESGDEIMIQHAEPYTTGCDAQFNSGNKEIIWAFDKNKHTTSLTTTPDFVFMDSTGKLYTMNHVKLKIIRSGKRNMLDGQVASMTTMTDVIKTVEGKRKLVFDANTKVMNAGAAEYKEKWQTDKDVFKKYILVFDENTCTYHEEEDCNGYLEKSINPYTKGLLGNFRPVQSLVFYDGRNGAGLTSKTNISNEGYLTNFTPYWNFNASHNLVPDLSNTKWVWNSQVTRVNARGLELETKNALDIYTAAQYGYLKTMPVAITNNARYNEAFFEGFEDNSFKNNLNEIEPQECATNKHIDLLHTLTNSRLVNTDTTGFQAHTGKYAIGIKSNETAEKVFNVIAGNPEAYALLFTKDTMQGLYDEGINRQAVSNYPLNCLEEDNATVITESFSDAQNEAAGSGIDIDSPKETYAVSDNKATATHSYSIKWDTYLKIEQKANYSFQFSFGTAYSYNPSSDILHNGYSNSLDLKIYTLDNVLIGSDYNSVSTLTNPTTSKTYTKELCPGIYKIVATGSELCGITYNSLNVPDPNTQNVYRWQCLNYNAPVYESLDKIDGCIFTVPIPGKDSMLNPVFNIPKDTMLFSGWVKKICGNSTTGAPCDQLTYDSNKVVLDFIGGTEDDVTLTSAGPIIDGWQRYEGMILVPETATTMTMRLINSSANEIYFDDIRMHPYHGNMKSYVYDPVSLRLIAQLDENNYASFYEYDEEGTLIRTKAETEEGIKTINETRSSKQKAITTIQQ